jgi:hypothetical protein
MKHPSLLFVIATSAALLGCAEDVSVGPAPVAPALWQNAQDNQARMAAEGMALDGRAWLSPDSYVAFYSGGGRQVQVPIIRANQADAARWHAFEAEPGESYPAYLARVGGPVAMVAGGGAKDVALFASAPDLDDGSATTAAELTNEHCDLTTFEQECDHRLHMRGSSHVNGGSIRTSALVSTWKSFDRTTSSHEVTATGVRHLVCADRGTTDVSIILTGFGSPVVSTFSVPQGSFGVANAVAGFFQTDTCHAAFLDLCLDWIVDTQMWRFETITSITPRTTGANHHWCGNTSELSNYRFSDNRGDRCSGTECPHAFIN